MKHLRIYILALSAWVFSHAFVFPLQAEDQSAQSVNTDYWLPYCFLVSTDQNGQSPQAQDIGKRIKAIADVYGGCGIAVKPFVYRVAQNHSKDPEALEGQAAQACNFLQAYGVRGAIQMFIPDSVQSNIPEFPTIPEAMCRDPGEVAGCSSLCKRRSFSVVSLDKGANSEEGQITSIHESLHSNCCGQICVNAGDGNERVRLGGRDIGIDRVTKLLEEKSTRQARKYDGTGSASNSSMSGPTFTLPPPSGGGGGGSSPKGGQNAKEPPTLGKLDPQTCASLQAGAPKNFDKYKWDPNMPAAKYYGGFDTKHMHEENIKDITNLGNKTILPKDSGSGAPDTKGIANKATQHFKNSSGAAADYAQQLDAGPGKAHPGQSGDGALGIADPNIAGGENNPIGERGVDPKAGEYGSNRLLTQAVAVDEKGSAASALNGGYPDPLPEGPISLDNYLPDEVTSGLKAATSALAGTPKTEPNASYSSAIPDTLQGAIPAPGYGLTGNNNATTSKSGPVGGSGSLTYAGSNRGGKNLGDGLGLTKSPGQRGGSTGKNDAKIVQMGRNGDTFQQAGEEVVRVKTTLSNRNPTNRSIAGGYESAGGAD